MTVVDSAAATRRPVGGCPPGATCVLFVDDHHDTRTATARLLKLEGFGVLTAGTIAEARRLLAGGSVDVLICDVQLPDGDGCELMALATAARRGRAPRGIVISGHQDEQFVRRCKQAGFAEYLIKPVPWQDLLASVRALTPKHA